MPYIGEQNRVRLESAIDEIVGILNEKGVDGNYPVGHLNYLITSIIVKTLDRQGKRYKHFNAVVGALECCKLELYRRAVAPYEDTKIEENGDVY